MNQITDGTDGMRIVVVEDEGAIREGITRMINGHTRHQVVEACKNGFEGVEVISREKPDCVITDIRMDGMDGLEMLQKLHDKKIMPYSIILSGYSDFEYAREGLRLGVEEYLLKPISIDTLEQTLEKVEQKLLKSRSERGYQIENDMRACLFGQGEESAAASDRICDLFGEEQTSLMLTGYYANAEQEMEVLERQIRSFRRQCDGMDCFEMTDRAKKLRTIVLIGKPFRLEDALRMFADIVADSPTLQPYEILWACATPQIVTCRQWHDVFLAEKHILDNALAGKKRGILFAEEHKTPDKVLEYPHGIEKKILHALGNSNREEAESGIREFLDTVLSEAYATEDIRRIVLKLNTQMMDTAKEINQKAYESLRTKNSMQDILNACTRTELQKTLGDAAALICEKERKDGISNYTINKTLEYIRIHFKEGITLEETAEMLNITPEYLSMLFKREMGMNFSVFLKKFRISHAKRLLKGTDMKVYEVAQECGYSNSNYFTRVFKEETGISPAEYH